mgnify:CR=1 FL=1
MRFRFRNFVVVMITPVAISSIHWKYYIVYAVIAACIPVSVYLFFPETMGRNLEEIELMFKDSPSVWQTVKFARDRKIAMPQEFISEKDAEKKAEHEEARPSESQSA